jgi:Cys-rich protein (TIGR01571 family)
MARVSDTNPAAQIPTREEIRERYDVRGNGFTDCLAAFCCYGCSLTQERREIDLEERSFHK